MQQQTETATKIAQPKLEQIGHHHKAAQTQTQ
jgi:hypothetical protein